MVLLIWCSLVLLRFIIEQISNNSKWYLYKIIKSSLANQNRGFFSKNQTAKNISLYRKFSPKKKSKKQNSYIKRHPPHSKFIQKHYQVNKKVLKHPLLLISPAIQSVIIFFPFLAHFFSNFRKVLKVIFRGSLIKFTAHDNAAYIIYNTMYRKFHKLEKSE